MINTDLTRIYREFDQSCARHAYRIRSSGEFETQLFIPTVQAKMEMEEALTSLLAQAESLPAPDPVFQLLRSHFAEFLKGQLSSLRSGYDRPGQWVGGLTNFIDYMVRKDSRTAQERLTLLETRLSQVDKLWAALGDRLKQLGVDGLGELGHSCETLVRVLETVDLELYFKDLSSQAREGLALHLGNLARHAQGWQQEVSVVAAQKDRGTVQGNSQSLKLDEGYYRKLLEEDLGVDLDELLSWFEQEVENTRREVFAVVSRLKLNPQPKTMAEVAEALNTHAGPCGSVEEMFERGRAYLERAREGVKGYVTLPQEKCLVVPVPQQIKSYFPWGGYGNGCPRSNPLTGEMYLNDANYKAVTDGWLKMMAIHEAYPGHHVQFVRALADPLPETVKMGARSIPLIEGVAHRSERVFEFVFAEDPFYPLFVSYRRHHTSVRIKAELSLRYFGRPIDEVVQLYMDELGFDGDTARGQVRAQEMMVGYFNCYYYGMKQLADLEEQFGYDEKSFTQLLFSVGRISLASFNAFLDLSPEEKLRFQTEFPSLIAL